MPDDLICLARYRNVNTGAKIQLVLLAVILFIIAVWDYRYHEIPDRFLIIIALLSFLQFQPVHILGIFCALPYLLVAVFGRENGIGGGDIKLTAATGLILGLPSALEASVIGLCAFLAGTFFSNILRKREKSRENTKTARPLGPYLAAAVMVEYIMNFGG